jgi:predicted GNAT family acetyltransferase
MDVMVRNNVAAGSYDAVVDGQVVGMVVYERKGDRVIVRHTIVEPGHRGQGIATTLVRAALDDLAANQLSLTNYCGFITEFIAANPGYAGLLDQQRPGMADSRDRRSRVQRLN